MNKIMFFLFVFFNASAHSVILNPKNTDDAVMSNHLKKGIIMARENIERYKSTLIGENEKIPQGFATKFTKKIPEGTMSYWEVRNKQTDTIIDEFYARNGDSLPAHPRFDMTRNQFGRDYFASLDYPTSGGDAFQPQHFDYNRDQTFKDAELKALSRIKKTRNDLGLESSDISVKAYIDKAPCTNCAPNLDAAENTTDNGVASEIEVDYYDDKSIFGKARKRIIIAENKGGACL